MTSDVEPTSRVVQIDDYQVLSRVGRGPRAEVWHARAANGREVALKVFHPHLAQSPNFVFRFEKETSALSAVSHPHVARLLDRGRRDAYFIATEWLGATSLRERITGPIAPNEAAAIGLAICDVLDYTHRRGLPHRNLCPENVFVDSSKHVRVSDFGLARLSNTNFAEFPPDECRNDLYDLGVLLYRLVTNRAPQDPLLLPSKLVPGIPKRLDEVIGRALAASQGGRFGRASEMALALRLVTSGSNGVPEKHEAEAMSFTVDGRFISVVVAPDATAAGCEAGLAALGKHLSQPGPWRVAYDFGNLLQLDNGVQAAILRLHLRHQKNLERVAFYSPRSLVRASALVVGSSVKRLPWKSFAGEALMRTWLWESA